MALEHRLLLGLHDEFLLDTYREIAEHEFRYVVDVARDADEMLAKARGPYSRYLMDANLGRPNTPDPTPAKQVYALVRPRILAGEARFAAISGNRQLVLARHDLPLFDKTGFDLLGFLQKPY